MSRLAIYYSPSSPPYYQHWLQSQASPIIFLSKIDSHKFTDCIDGVYVSSCVVDESQIPHIFNRALLKPVAFNILPNEFDIFASYIRLVGFALLKEVF